MIKVRSGFRKIHRSDGIWQWKKGKYQIVIFSPENKKYLTDESEVTGWSWDDLERAYYKKYATGVLPSHIVSFIEKLKES